jgi:hypothetical protein
VFMPEMGFEVLCEHTCADFLKLRESVADSE